jgi:phage-related protein
MPPSAANAVTSTVLPFNLARAYVADSEFAQARNDYPDGSSQRRPMALTPRRGWKLTHRLPPALAVELRDFYLARGGGHEAFLFYDVHQTDPPFSYDETGAAEAGRFAVVFRGGWNQSADPGLIDCGVELIEVA